MIIYAPLKGNGPEIRLTEAHLKSDLNLCFWVGYNKTEK